MKRACSRILRHRLRETCVRNICKCSIDSRTARAAAAEDVGEVSCITEEYLLAQPITPGKTFYRVTPKRPLTNKGLLDNLKRELKYCETNGIRSRSLDPPPPIRTRVEHPKHCSPKHAISKPLFRCFIPQPSWDRDRGIQRGWS